MLTRTAQPKEALSLTFSSFSLPQALEALEDAIKACETRSRLAELTSKFYTIIPHDFGRRTPPVIADLDTLQKKFEMLLVLGDIELAQGLQKEKEKREVKGVCVCVCDTRE